MSPASSNPRLSRVRTVVLWGLLVVWFSEMTLWGVRPLSEMWTQFWQLFAYDDASLGTALYMTHAFEAAEKGALGVLAVFALRSRSPFVRTALFVPMALVPPLNLAFPFRVQGFPLRPTMIGTVLSIVLWGSFFLFRERAERPSPAIDASAGRVAGRFDSLRQGWFVANAVILTLAAALFLFAPHGAVKLTLPCLWDGIAGEHTALKLTALTVGTHLTAVATASWIGTLYSRSNPTVRTAMTVSNTVHAGLLCFVPLTQLALNAGRDCATSSILIYAVPLFAGWLIYDTLAYRATLTARPQLANPVVH